MHGIYRKAFAAFLQGIYERMMANVITGLRILVTCGLSDMVDGIIARKTNSVSDFGSKFDGVADFVFVGVCLIKILPVMDIPICFVATFAAVQEGHFIRTRKGIKT